MANEFRAQFMMIAIPLLISSFIGFVVDLALVFKSVVFHILSGHWRVFGGFAHSAFPFAFMGFYREHFVHSQSIRFANAGYISRCAIGGFHV